MSSLLDVRVFSSPISIYTALAAEQCYFDEYSAAIPKPQTERNNRHTVMFWKSSRAIVIGRNQNPWRECNIPFLLEHNIDLARRDTGGGSVYHDEGNLNISVITQITDGALSNKTDCATFGMQNNLRVLAAALKQTHGIQADITDKHDMMVSSKKITGSAMRVVSKVLLHHFTLLLNVELPMLRESLRSSSQLQLNTKAVASRPHSVANIHCAANSIIDAYVQGMEQMLKTPATIKKYVGIPTGEETQTAFAKHRTRLQSNEWVFNRSPQFTVRVPVEGIMCTAQFIDGELESVRRENTVIKPNEHIDMSPESLYAVEKKAGEHELIRNIARRLYNNYYGKHKA